MNFIPENDNQSVEIPYFDDVTGKDGWQGHSTTKSIDSLKSDIMSCISRLGGLVSGFQKGTFQVNEQQRDGFRVIYTIDTLNGLIPGRIDVAALPVKSTYKNRKSLEVRKEKSLKMALYMLRMALDGTWFLQQLSPGYSALLPWMLGDSDKTFSQLWVETSNMSNLLPAPDDEFLIEGEVFDV